jgi:hypothetical protein
MLDLLWLGLRFFGALTSGDLSSHGKFHPGKSIQDALSKIPRLEPMATDWMAGGAEIL